MRFKTFIRGGHRAASLGPTGGDATGPVTLVGDPTALMEAVTKQYVDRVASELDATAFTTGTIPSARIPAFSGDLIKAEGASTITLPDRSVQLGNFPKVRVNTKGLIVSGSALSIDDIPNMTWAKITSDKPTTAAGYGITDALLKTSPIMTGILKVGGVFNENTMVVNKEYVDDLLVPRSVIGDIEYKLTSVTPPKCLRANGGAILKTDYPVLYDKLGDKYTPRLSMGSGRPWESQYDLNQTQSSETLGSYNFSNESDTIRLTDTSVVVTNKKVHFFGGNIIINLEITPSQFRNIITYTVDDSDNLVFSTEHVNALPTGDVWGDPIVAKGKLYVFSKNNMCTASINTDGSIGTFTTNLSPTFSERPISLLTKNRIYLFGSSTENSATAPIDQNGNIGLWTSLPLLPFDCRGASIFITDKRVYVVGATTTDGSTTSRLPIWTTTVDYDGFLSENWTRSGSLDVEMSYSAVYLTNHRVYLLTSSAGTAGAISSCPINADGTLGSWSRSDTNTYPLIKPAAAAVGGYLYMFGSTSNLSTSPVYLVRHPIQGNITDYTTYNLGTTNDNSLTFNLPTVNPIYPGTYTYIRIQN